MFKFAKLLAAVVLILTGLFLAMFGNTWGPLTFEFLSDSELGEWVGLIVPFTPMAFIGSGAVLIASRHRG